MVSVCIPNHSMCAARKPEIVPGEQATSITHDLGIDELRLGIGAVGNTDNEVVYGYVVRTVHLSQGKFDQQGSGPNWDGGQITLCTCKHSMRASLPTHDWLKGKWVAGLTGWNDKFGKQQSLIYLMRVGEAYDSQAAMVHQLRISDRESVVRAKDSSVNLLGDLMIPIATDTPSNPFSPDAYHPPLIGHPHRLKAKDTGWQYDVHYVGRGGREAAMLVGDSRFSFRWTQPMVRRSQPGYTRPYRIWTLSDFLADIEGVST